MRPNLFGCLALACATLGACASAPPAKPPPDVPMYSNQEWSQMHSDKSVPEIPDDQAATTDPNAPGPNDNTQSNGHVVVVPITNGPGNPAGSSLSDGSTTVPTVRPTIPPAKPKSSSH